MWLTDLLATFHVLFAVAWLGGAIMFGVIIAPAAARISPAASREFFVRVAPGVLRFFQIVPVLAIFFGLLLLYNMTGGDWSMLSSSTSWGLDTSVGMAFGIGAFVVGEGGAAPALQRMIRLLSNLGSPGGPSPEEVPRAAMRARVMATATLVLLLGAMVFMVGAGFY